MNRRDFLLGSAAVTGLTLATMSLARAQAMGAAHEPFEDLAGLVTSEMERLKVPGAALGVLKDGVLMVRGFGVTSIENPLPVDENTVFELASLSKTVTATAAMSLVEKGSLDLDGPVRRWLPDWRVGDEGSSSEMLLRHLLTHTTGLNGSAPTADLGVETLGRFAANMGGLARLAPPGTRWSYLNPGYALTGRLIEVATGTDIHSAFKSLVFEPLGLTRATTRLDELATFRLAVGHEPGENGAPVVVRPYSMGSSIPAGGVNMSITDLMRYAAFHLDEGEAGEATVLTPETRLLMREPHIVKAPTEDWMGIGWHLRTVGGVLTAAHGGTAGAGHRLLIELVPERRLAFAILTNHVDGWRLNQVVEQALLKAYEGISVEPNQRVTYRGINEDFKLYATPLAPQPDFAEYVGSYTRGPSSPLEVSAADGALKLGNATLTFFSADMAYSSSNGTPCEFIRDEAGAVKWIRSNGQGFGLKTVA